MIKKIVSVLLVLALVGLAVFKIFFDSSSFRGELKKVKDELSSYYMEANMELINGEDIRQFFVEVGYRREDNKDLFRVSLLDKGLNQEQILIRNLGKEANINKVHPHKFRRTMATMAIDKGMPIEQVQKLLGHIKIDTTMEYAMVNQNNVKNSHRKYIT